MKISANPGSRFETLYQKLRKFYKIDVEEFPLLIESKFGQQLTLISDGEWVQELIILLPSYSNEKIKFSDEIHSHPVIDYMAR